jgi:hypothetical protein
MPSLAGATDWLNSPPLSPQDLRGQVVVVDFGTYTCINWIRTLPYRRAWAEKYRSHGLVVLAVHTPEFSFEKDIDNVRRSLRDMGIEYPVAVDSDYAIWRAFDNHYWPALYLVDAEGQIRHHHFGEGGYAQTEAVLQQLLAESGAIDVPEDLVDVVGLGAEAEADWGELRSAENYVGYLRTEHLASFDERAIDMPHVYVAPDRLELNQWSPSGDWTISDESASLNEPHGRIEYCFHARDLNLVMGPVTHGSQVRFRVLVDGSAPGSAHGVDVDEQGFGTVADQRVYQLLRQPNEIGDHRFAIEFDQPGVQAYVFTFG